MPNDLTTTDESKILRAALAHAEDEIVALRVAVETAVTALREWSRDAENCIMRLDEYDTSMVDAVTQALEDSLKGPTDA